MFERQQKVLRTINDYLSKLPEGIEWTLWAAEATPTTFNILIPELERTAIHELLQLPIWPHERGSRFVSYRVSADLTVSLVDPDFYEDEPFEERMNDEPNE